MPFLLPRHQIHRVARLPAMAATIIFLLAGCVSLAPPYKEPALPVSPAYASDTPQEGVSAVAIGWHDYFTDPQLRALIRMALDNNRDLRTAVLRVEEARALYGIQRSEQFPAFGARTSLDRSRIPADLSLIGKPLEGSQYRVELGLTSWEIDFWGRVRNLTDTALENYLATDAASRAATIALVAQVANSYLILRELNERKVLADRTIASRSESLRIFTRRVEVGSTSRFNLTEMQIRLDRYFSQKHCCLINDQ